jgi:hypothetical protein
MEMDNMKHTRAAGRVEERTYAKMEAYQKRRKLTGMN